MRNRAENHIDSFRHTRVALVNSPDWASNRFIKGSSGESVELDSGLLATKLPSGYHSTKFAPSKA